MGGCSLKALQHSLLHKSAAAPPDPELSYQSCTRLKKGNIVTISKKLLSISLVKSSTELSSENFTHIVPKTSSNLSFQRQGHKMFLLS